MRDKEFWPRVDAMMRRLIDADVSREGMSASAIADYCGIEKRTIQRLERRALGKIRAEFAKIYRLETHRQRIQ